MDYNKPFDGSTTLDEMTNLTTTELQTEANRARRFLVKCVNDNPADFSTRGEDLFRLQAKLKINGL